MNPSLRIALATAALGLALVQQASAGEITSSADPALAGGTVITFDGDAANFYTSLFHDGVTFASGPDTPFIEVTSFDGQFNTSGNSISNSTQNPDLLFSFATPLTAFGFSYGAADLTATLNVYDTSHNLIDSVTLAANDNSGAGNDGAFYGYAAPNIGSAELIAQFDTRFDDYDEVLLDNFTINPPAGGTATGAPEPASLALLGVGLAGLGLARRRRK